jgi:Ni/Co efflux regulator RcnB
MKALIRMVILTASFVLVTDAHAEPRDITLARDQYQQELHQVRTRYVYRLDELERVYTQRGDSESLQLVRTEKTKVAKSIRDDTSDPGMKSVGHPVIGKWTYEFNGAQMILEFNQRFFTLYKNGKEIRSDMYDVIDNKTVRLPFPDRNVTYTLIDKDTLQSDSGQKAKRMITQK